MLSHLDDVTVQAFLRNGYVPAAATMPKRKGERLIIVHALTTDGLLAVDHTTPATFLALDVKPNSIRYTSEMVFQANSNAEDYHANFDGLTSLVLCHSFPYPVYRNPQARCFSPGCVTVYFRLSNTSTRTRS